MDAATYPIFWVGCHIHAFCNRARAAGYAAFDRDCEVLDGDLGQSSLSGGRILSQRHDRVHFSPESGE
jgi:hypothetical protein